MEFTRTIDHALYPRKAIADAAQAYQQYCTFRMTPTGNGKAVVTIIVKETHRNQEKQVALEFWNYALDRSIQVLLDQD